jgi:AcrR family transcriptional regulator
MREYSNDSLMLSTTNGPGLLDLLHDTDDPEPATDRALDGALAAFLDFGIRRTSVNEIARRSDISPATLYRWYGSKDGIVGAVALRETRRFLAELETHVAPDSPPEDQLAEVSVIVARRLRDQPLLQRLIETEPEDILPRLTTHGWPIIRAGAEYLTGHIERLMDAGQLARFDPGPLAEILARVTHSLLLTPTTSLRLDDDDSIRSNARDTFRWLLRLPPRTSPPRTSPPRTKQ